LALASLASLASLTACGAPTEDTSIDLPFDAQAAQGTAVECPTRTALWQNLSPGKPCPDVRDANQDGKAWTGRPTFDAGRPNATTYCKYTWNDPVAPPDFDELNKGLNPDDKPELRPGFDCPVVAALGPAPIEYPSEAAPIWTPLRDQYWRQAGRVPAKPPGALGKVRVAVLDTSKEPYLSTTAPVYAEGDGHGRLVGRAIGDLACPGALEQNEPCAIDIANYPALARKGSSSVPEWHDPSPPDPNVPPDDGPPEGGYYGSLGELAESIERALAGWNHTRSRGGAQRLIINLSLGWSPIFGGQLITKPGQPIDLKKLPQPARPVYEALARASCAGALVVVAAGNYDTFGGKGMMYPAAWESLPAPSQTECAKYPLPNKDIRPLPIFPNKDEKTYRPLVYAAGVIDERDQPLGISRVHGRPRLAAYGLGVAAFEPRTGGGTPIKTGTSLAAATVSGAAALAWSYKPELRPDQLMDLVYQGGQEIAPKADVLPDVCAGSTFCSAQPTRRISACTPAALALCGATTCPGQLECEKPLPLASGQPADVPTDWPALGLPAVEKLTTGDACKDGLELCMSWSGDTTQGFPWVGPQPSGGGCDTCLYSLSQSKLYIGLDAYARTCAYSITASVETEFGTQTYDATPPPATAIASTLDLAGSAPALGLDPAAVTPGPTPPPPPFVRGLFSVPLPVDPATVRAITLWFHTSDTEHEGGAYTRAEGIPIVR
jgi:hypothetical protein